MKYDEEEEELELEYEDVGPTKKKASVLVEQAGKGTSKRQKSGDGGRKSLDF